MSGWVNGYGARQRNGPESKDGGLYEYNYVQREEKDEEEKEIENKRRNDRPKYLKIKTE